MNKILFNLTLFILCIILGIALTFGYEFVYETVYTFVHNNVNLKDTFYKPVTLIFVGTIYVGVLVYFFVSFVLSGFASEIFNYLVKEMRKQQILPVNFKTKKKFYFGNVYNDITEIFNTFIRLFFDVKQDKDKFLKVLEMHLDPNVKKEIEQRNIDEIYIGNKTKTGTILFSDLRGFTYVSEFYSPDEVVMILNEYLSESTKIINKYHGRVNKYIGDAILAIFEEAPKYADYMDQDKAILAALDMQVQFQILLKRWKKKINPLLKIGLGIGLSRGQFVVGNIGSESRMEYAVIGDTVNFASRLCSIAKDGEIIISDNIYLTMQNLLIVDVLQPVEIKGKTGKYNIYSVKTRKMLV
ncbi:MAG: adenylate/guanylate cyclase domain-containing protein [Candidatus Goldbacteria bacterium]|nr:adenylate/guanylate cyclase domain-containing protein [Candidatus Goldiibacteriota bacterium]